MEGKTVRLERPAAARDAALLFEATHGEDADPGQWTYMAYGAVRGRSAGRMTSETGCRPVPAGCAAAGSGGAGYEAATQRRRTNCW